MSVCAELTKLLRIFFYTNLDPDPEWLLICYMCCNTMGALVMFFVAKHHKFYLVNNYESYGIF